MSSALTTIGLLGGTFDPIHIGHLRPALDIKQAIGLDKLLLLPNHVPPHRDTPRATSAQRKKMVELAISGIVGLSVDDRELKHDKPSYTVDTLAELRADYPEASISFLMGMDSLRSLPSWHRWHELLDLAHIVVSHRPGWKPPTDGEAAELLANYSAKPEVIREKKAGHIILVNAPQIDISSTRIRHLIKHHQDTSFLMPDAVKQYIEQLSLYR
ncbi:nicotinate-nucleotide adenylyltransferase [Corallincola platygyrae]|uniref:Probable nicotinate-nucleotide adenylyltransferase n=1 Tax=Corallincola platygyrae TaxID=1193278 RepID=A0ABW4XQN7_9GAMM